MSVETTQSQSRFQELSLYEDPTWIFMKVLQKKGLPARKGKKTDERAERPAVDMLVHNGQDINLRSFFSFVGRVEGDRQFLEIDWPSRHEDARILSDLIVLLSGNYDSEAVLELLKQSPLFAALQSSSIIVTKEQVDEEGVPIRPFGHIVRVENNSYFDLPISEDDKIVAYLLPWLHDIGKMAGINFLQDGAIFVENMREKLQEIYGEASKNTHPSHALVGTIILQRLFSTIAENANITEPNQEVGRFLQNDSNEMSLLLNVVFHHHHFLYYGEDRHGPAPIWLEKEINNVLIPTLPRSRPDLIVRFFALFFQFRLADIKATPAHQRHWQGNYNWFSQVPRVLKTLLPDTEEVRLHIDILEGVIKDLPTKLD